jgi:hypothetical protein
MPKEYEAVRDSLKRRGKPSKLAKRIAAALWNKRHPDDTNPWNREKKRRKKS